MVSWGSISRWPLWCICSSLWNLSTWMTCSRLLSDWTLIIKNYYFLWASFYWFKNVTNIGQLFWINLITFLRFLLFLSTLWPFFTWITSSTIYSRLLFLFRSYKSIHESCAEFLNIRLVYKSNNTSLLNDCIRIISSMLLKISIHYFAMLKITYHIHQCCLTLWTTIISWMFSSRNRWMVYIISSTWMMTNILWNLSNIKTSNSRSSWCLLKHVLILNLCVVCLFYKWIACLRIWRYLCLTRWINLKNRCICKLSHVITRTKSRLDFRKEMRT